MAKGKLLDEERDVIYNNGRFNGIHEGQLQGFEEGREWERQEINRIDGWKVFWIMVSAVIVGGSIMIGFCIAMQYLWPLF